MNLTYEQAYAKLETIVEQLQDENTSLDEAIKLFQEGVELQQYCNNLIKEAENKVAKIINENGGVEEFIHEQDVTE